MSAWAAKRRSIYVLGVFIFLTFILTTTWFYFFYNPPTCYDGIQNGTEEGIDCSGGCNKICSVFATVPNITWARGFEVTNGVYNIASLVNNPNTDLQAKARYIFRAYNKEGLLVHERMGSTKLAPSEKKVIFEPTVSVGEQTVDKVFFEFTGNIEWEQAVRENKKILATTHKITEDNGKTLLEVTTENITNEPLYAIEIVAVLLDEDNNLRQTSRTIIDYLAPQSRDEAFFSWNGLFAEEVQVVEVYFTENADII